MDYSAIIQLVMQMAGELSAQGKKDKAQALLQGSLDKFGQLSLPNFQQAVAQTLGPSALASIQADPRLKAAQNASLSSYDDIIGGQGYSAADKANINSVGNQIATRQAGANSAVRQQMEASGQGQSGAAIAAQLENQQQANQRFSEAGQNQVAQGVARRFQAIHDKGQLASDMNSQDWSQQSAKAQAADQIAQYNASARTAANGQNNSNAQTIYADAYGRLQGQAGMTGQVAQNLNTNAAQIPQNMAGLGSTMAAVMRGAGSSNATANGTGTGGYLPTPAYPTTGSAADEWDNPYNTSVRSQSIWEGW